MTRTIIRSAVVLVFLGSLYAGCTNDFDQFEPSGGTAGTTTGGGGQGGGGPAGCMSDAACNDMNPCTKDTCDTGAGKCQNESDDTIEPNDSNGCTTDVCSGGVPMYTNVPAEEPCGDSLICDGMGSCIGCSNADQCAPTGDPCKVRTCIDQTCGTMGADAGKDCDAGVCDGQGTCVQCIENQDCPGPSNDCINNVCVETCEDGTLNGNETDIDCGGDECSDCADGEMCNNGDDCDSNRCTNGICTSCMDGAQNGSETDVDCGGFCQANCADGEMCNGDGDCDSDRCTSGICTSCMDMVKNDAETDVDCGGPCPDCPDGKMCNNDGDCENDCDNGVCEP